MGGIKPAVEAGEVAALLAWEFGEAVGGVRPLAGGNVARTFAAEVGGRA